MKPSLVLGLALLAVATSVGPSARGAEALKPLEVRTVCPMRGEAIRYATFPGTIKANQQATLYAKVAGYLKSLNVDKGDRVEAGQQLGEIEVPELEVETIKHRAEISVAEAEFKRVSAARDSAPDLVTPQSVDEARGRLEIARANLERVETLLRYSRLTVPFAGLVTARYADPGSFIPVPSSGTSAQTAAIVTVMDFRTVRAQAAIPEMEASLARVGQPVRVTVEGLPGRTFTASVSRIAYALDEATRTMLVEADVPNADLSLRPGMYATIKVGLEKHEDVSLLPAEALIAEKGGASVFVAANGAAHKRPIKVGFSDGAKVEVVSGLGETESVILVGKQTLVDGQPVKAVEVKP